MSICIGSAGIVFGKDLIKDGGCGGHFVKNSFLALALLFFDLEI